VRRMMTTFTILFLALLVLLAMASCVRIGSFNPFLGGGADSIGDAASEQGLIDATNTDAISGEAADDFPFAMTGAVGAGTLTHDTNQVVIVSFVNGIVDVDSADPNGPIPGLSIYPLADAAASDEPYVRGAGLSYLSVVAPGSDGASDAYLAVDLTGVASNRIEIFVDPAAVTANGGVKLLNGDSDDVPGEAEDAGIAPLAVSGGVALTTGVDRAPRLDVDGNFESPGVDVPSGFTDGASVLTLSGFDVNDGWGYIDVFDADSIGAGISLYMFNPSDQTWAAVSEASRAYDDVGGNFTITTTNSFAGGEIYQARYNRYNIATAVEVYGFIQREYYQQNDSANNLTRTPLQVIDGAGVPEYAGLDSAFDDLSEVSITLDFYGAGGAGTGNIVTSTITPDSVRFFHDSGPGLMEIPYESFVVTDLTPGNNHVRFFFDPILAPSAGQSWRALVYPSVMVDAETPGDPDDDVPVLNRYDIYKGVFDFTSTWG
jgi:hypothetical protein